MMAIQYDFLALCLVHRDVSFDSINSLQFYLDMNLSTICRWPLPLSLDFFSLTSLVPVDLISCQST